MLSGFLLCILSPVWRAKLCGDIGEKPRQNLNLEGEDETVFSQLLELGCGNTVQVVGGLQALLELGKMADRFQVETVQNTVEHAILSRLTVESCASVMSLTCESGLERLQCASRALALREFDAFASSAGFVELGEELLGSLLEDDELRSDSEERVFETVVRWMTRGGVAGAARGGGLLRKVRFPFMAAAYLETVAKAQLATHGLDALAAEGLRLKDMEGPPWCGDRLEQLEATALVPRRAGHATWGNLLQQGEFRRPTGLRNLCVALHDGSFCKSVCVGCSDGSIQVWCRSTLARSMVLRGHYRGVWALAPVGELLVSGSDDADIRVWDMPGLAGERGRCLRILKGHTRRVLGLAVSGGRLVSGSRDGTLRVWRMRGPVSEWECVRTLCEHESGVCCLAVWGGRVASGSWDGTIAVWDLATGVLDRALEGHHKTVTAVVASGPRLISAGMDGTVRVWSMATWECVLTADVHGRDGQGVVHGDVGVRPDGGGVRGLGLGRFAAAVLLRAGRVRVDFGGDNERLPGSAGVRGAGVGPGNAGAHAHAQAVCREGCGGVGHRRRGGVGGVREGSGRVGVAGTALGA
jgi:hypothetical protein